MLGNQKPNSLSQYNTHNNHRNDVTTEDGIPASSHFDIEWHNFNTHAKSVLIEQINQLNQLDNLTLRKRLKIRAKSLDLKARTTKFKISQKRVEQNIVPHDPVFRTLTQQRLLTRRYMEHITSTKTLQRART